MSKEIGDVIGVNLDDYLPKPRLVDEIIGFVTDEAAKGNWFDCGDSSGGRL